MSLKIFTSRTKKFNFVRLVTKIRKNNRHYQRMEEVNSRISFNKTNLRTILNLRQSVSNI